MPSKLLLGAFASHSATTPTMQRTAARVTMGNALHSIRRVCSSGLNRVFGRAALVTPTATPSRSQPIAFLTTRPSSTIAAPAFAPSPAFGVTPNHLQLPIRRHFLRHPHSHSHSLSSPRSHRRLFSLNSTPAAHQAVLGRLDLTPPREGEMDDEGRVYDPRLRSEVCVCVRFVDGIGECDRPPSPVSLSCHRAASLVPGSRPISGLYCVRVTIERPTISDFISTTLGLVSLVSCHHRFGSMFYSPFCSRAAHSPWPPISRTRLTHDSHDSNNYDVN